MKKHFFSAMLLSSMLFGATSCTSPKPAAEQKEYPMFWTWMHYNDKMNFDSICQVMSEVGLEGVVLEAGSAENYRKAVPVAHKHGLKVIAWVWTMNDGGVKKDHPDWMSVNRNGKSLADTTAYVGYYQFMTPALDEVRQHINNRIKSICEVEGVDGISIDYHRFVDVVLPTTLWPTYNIVQDREYAAWDYGYHPAMIEKFKKQYGYDPREQEDVSKDEKWRQFRCDQISEVANMIAETVHSYGKIMAASPFPTPKMASRMVRQDWSDWNLDLVFPMVYYNFYTEDPTFVSDCTIENARDKNPNTTLYCGIMASETPEFFQAMDEALNNGAQGIAIFTVEGLRSPEYKQRFKAYTDSMRTVRANNGGVLKSKATVTAASTDPFAHKSVLKRIEDKIQQCVAKETGKENPGLKLTEYKKVDHYDVTTTYEVTDQNSKLSFHVMFYMYGDMLSGWNVELIKK